MITRRSPAGWAALPSYLVCDPSLTPLMVRVLLLVSAHQSRDPHDWPTTETLAAFCGLGSRRQVQRALAQLKARGLVELNEVYDAKQGQLPNAWTLRFDRFNGDRKTATVTAKTVRNRKLPATPDTAKDGPPRVIHDTPPRVIHDTPPRVIHDTPGCVIHDTPGVSSTTHKGIASDTGKQDEPPIPLAQQGGTTPAKRVNRTDRKNHDWAVRAGRRCAICERPILWSDDPAQLRLHRTAPRDKYGERHAYDVVTHWPCLVRTPAFDPDKFAQETADLAQAS